jgi:hypothetical protein
MGALAGARLTNERQRTKLNLGVAAAVLCYAGAIAALDASGNVKPGVTGTGLRGLGRFKDTVDNSAASLAAAVNADVEIGVFQFANSAAADADHRCRHRQAVLHRRRSDCGEDRRRRHAQRMRHDCRRRCQRRVGRFHHGPVARQGLPAAAHRRPGCGRCAVYGITSPVAGKITNILSSLERPRLRPAMRHSPARSAPAITTV